MGRIMRRKIPAAILTLALLAGLSLSALTGVPAARASGGGTALAYKVGEVASGEREEGEDVWYSLNIERDGLYKVSHRATTTSNYTGGGGVVNVYDSGGNVNLVFVIDAGYEITAYNYNNFENAFIREYAIYLHKGEYLLRETGGRGTNTYSFKVERLATPYGEDKEPNDTSDGAIPLRIGGRAGGVLGGVYASGEKDRTDFYALPVPQAMDIELHLAADRTPMDLQVFDGTGKTLLNGWETTTSANPLKGIHEFSKAVSFPEAGLYYIRITIRGDRGLDAPYSPYLLSAGKGPAQETKPADLVAIPTKLGVVLAWEPADNPYGYMVFRDGQPLSDYPVRAGSYLDVTAQPGKTYTYTVQPYNLGEEIVGASSAGTSTGTGDVIPAGGDTPRGYILMKIGQDTMVVNDEVFEIDPGRGTTPLIVNARTMVPIRAIIEAIGGTVGWEAPDRMVTIDANGHSLQMWLDRTDMMIDGKPGSMDVSPQAINDRTMLPVRFAIESIGCAIEWIGSTQEIVIVY